MLIYSKFAVIDSEGVELDVRFPSVNRLKGKCALSLILSNCVTGHACMIRRELLEHAMPHMSEMPFHDQLLVIVAAANGRLKVGDEVLSFYRKHSSSAVLGAKLKRRIPKYIFASERLRNSCEFVYRVIASGILDSRDQIILGEFYEKYIRNE